MEGKRLNINLTDEKHRELKAKAAAKGMTLTEVVKTLIDNWLKK
ncbi:MAG: plasmid partition protein ParG [Nanoarchaeota archaeon]|nr:plasmid partition protein ParG [Nanoarchaeota archaeon]